MQSCCSSAIPPWRDDSEYGEGLEKKQKRSASQSFLVPCDNASAKKQCISHCSGLEVLKVGPGYTIHSILAVFYEILNSVS